MKQLRKFNFPLIPAVIALVVLPAPAQIRLGSSSHEEYRQGKEISYCTSGGANNVGISDGTACCPPTSEIAPAALRSNFSPVLESAATEIFEGQQQKSFQIEGELSGFSSRRFQIPVMVVDRGSGLAGIVVGKATPSLLKDFEGVGHSNLTGWILVSDANQAGSISNLPAPEFYKELVGPASADLLCNKLPDHPPRKESHVFVSRSPSIDLKSILPAGS